MTKQHRASTTVAILAGIASAAIAAETPHLKLENDRYLIEVTSVNGRIARLYDKVGRLDFIQEPRLADNFKFSLPIRGETAWQSTEGNYVLGREQRLSSHESHDGTMVLKWAGPLRSVIDQTFDVSASMTIELVDEEIRFNFTIENRSKLEVGEVYYPILGGSLGLGDTPEARKKTELVMPWAAELRKANIFHTFANFSWLGVMGAEQYYAYPENLSMPWVELDAPDRHRGMYFGAHDPIARYKLIHLDMSPGTSGPRAEGNWPRPDELKGLPAGVNLCAVHFAYHPAGKDFAATPVVVRFHDGDWRDGARIYGRWMESHIELKTQRSNWLYQTQAFQQLGRVPFKDLPEWATQGVASGITTLLLTDWKAGGHGNGIPRFEPDPKLGSREEFAQALRKCHELGAKVVAVVNLQTVAQRNELYRSTLHDYACVDRWGTPYDILGAGEPSPVTGGYGSGERRVWLNPGHPGMRRYLTTQIKALAELGVDGVQLQDFFGRQIDFNPTVDATPDRASWEGGLACAAELQAAGSQVNPGFALSSDVPFDRMLGLTQVSSLGTQDDCAFRYAFPSWRPAFSVSSEDSLGAVRDAIRFRGRLRIAPANGQPLGGGEMKGIMGYVQSVLRVREVLKAALLNGETLAPATIRTQGAGARMVFRNAASGLRTAVLMNTGLEAVDVTIDGFADSKDSSPEPAAMVLWQPQGGATQMKVPARVSIPLRQIAIVTEEPAFDELSKIPRWQAPIGNERLVFDFTSPEDLRGWKLEGNAFSVSNIGIVGRTTLNSLAAAGEPAIGSALSPPFTIEPRFDHMELIYHGGTSRKEKGQETLCIQILDASTDTVLEQIPGPGTHELQQRQLALDPLRGRKLRVRLIDRNTAGSFAWIGLRRLALVLPTNAAQ